MARFTLLEVHLDGASFTANAPLSGDDGEDRIENDADSPTPTEAEDESSPLGLVLAFGVLVGLAVAVRRYLSQASDLETDSGEEEPIIAD